MNRTIHPSSIRPHLVLAIFATLFLFPTAIFAIREAKKCSLALAENHWDTALVHSRSARNWIIISTVLGIATLSFLAWIVYLLWPQFTILWENIQFIMTEEYPSYNI